MSGADTSCWSTSPKTVTIKTPVPGLVVVSGDVAADVDDIVRGDRRVDED